MGVFFDHTFQWYGANPNGPAGSSETFQAIRGLPVDVPPLVPEKGNVWPENQAPDATLQDIERQQAEEVRRTTGQAAPAPGVGGNPQVNRANNADQGLPGPQVQPGLPPAPLRQRPPNGTTLDTTGQSSARGYRDLQNAPNAGGGSVLIPNGNGTSTLIGPDGSVKTVPTPP